MVHESCGAEVVVTNLHVFPERPLGHVACRLPGDRNEFVRRVNRVLAEIAPSFVHIHDQAALSERFGLDAWFDERLCHHAKQPAAPEAQARLIFTLGPRNPNHIETLAQAPFAMIRGTLNGDTRAFQASSSHTSATRSRYELNR